MGENVNGTIDYRDNDCPLLLHLQVILEQLAAANLATEVQLLKPRAVPELPCTRQPRQLLHRLLWELLLLILWELLPIFPRKPLPLILMELLLRTASLHLLLLLLLFQEETCHLFPLIKLKLHHPFLHRKVFLLLLQEMFLLLLREVLQDHILLQEMPPDS